MSNYFEVGETELIAREGYGAVGLSWGDVTGLAKGALNFYGESQKTAGSAAAYKAQAELLAKQQAAAKTSAPKSGLMKALPFIAIGGGALVLLLVLRKK